MSTELSPAERFARAKQRGRTPELDLFRRDQRFDLDDFQQAACTALEQGRSVLVAAPTGAGKTIVAEFGVHLTMRHPTDKIFYTTPIKALSNQKFNEFVRAYGASEVGLLTGDTNVNPQARIVVMTTEVLRNMLYAGSDLLRDLRFVVMDEVHYLADRFRGAVWEEVIIHLPSDVRMISLSATVSNAEEFGDWLQAVRGDTDVIVSEERPVPLHQHVLVRGRMVDLFDSSGQAATHRVNPELARLANGRTQQKGGKGRGRPMPRFEERVDRAALVAMLGEAGLIPAIFFIFSRAGCDGAVRQVLRAGVRLTEEWEREEIRSIVEERCRTIRDEDLAVLGYWEWLEGLLRGVAAHHAGMLPAFKEVVEELFQKKLVKLVFATETLALGVNMPARTVVLEKLEKFNGEGRVPITPGEYTQLTGRAGRRGIDVEGHAVIQWTSELDPQAVASLASRRTYPMNSSFKPTYNMTANLVDQFGRRRTREILESSFAQFQADRAVVDLARKVRAQQESLRGYEQSMSCHLGDFREYASIRRELGDVERKKTVGLSRSQRDRRQEQLQKLRERLRKHDCHGCPEREQHARWAERWGKLKRQTDELRAQIERRTGAVAKIFDRVSDVLLELGYLERADGELTLAAHGRTLRRVYGERDLLVAESLRRGYWNDLDAPSLAAMATVMVFESRREEPYGADRNLPRGPFRHALDRTLESWANLDDLERDHRLPGSAPPSTGLALAMHRWASGSPLDAVLRDADLAAGDFVRWSKQTIDLLDQLSVVAQSPVDATARLALDAVRRGIVAYSSVA
ncbi:MAG: DEAD/DEAH box helicase [Microbacteriaceae bacterium]